jgi:predicted nucleic acid-binding Zn ribbon protein
MSKRQNDSFKIDDLMKSFVKENKLEKGLDKVNVEAAWAEMMGNGVNTYTKSVKLHKGVLYVELGSSVLREELSYGKDKIINMLNESLGKNLITKLILR